MWGHLWSCTEQFGLYSISDGDGRQQLPFDVPSRSERLLRGWGRTGREQGWKARSSPAFVVVSSRGFLPRGCSHCHRAFSPPHFQPGWR